jgi:hypothetical protein
VHLRRTPGGRVVDEIVRVGDRLIDGGFATAATYSRRSDRLGAACA